MSLVKAICQLSLKLMGWSFGKFRNAVEVGTVLLTCKFKEHVKNKLYSDSYLLQYSYNRSRIVLNMELAISEDRNQLDPTVASEYLEND